MEYHHILLHHMSLHDMSYHHISYHIITSHGIKSPDSKSEESESCKYFIPSDSDSVSARKMRYYTATATFNLTQSSLT
jgi:hypothetical protein